MKKGLYLFFPFLLLLIVSDASAQIIHHRVKLEEVLYLRSFQGKTTGGTVRWLVRVELYEKNQNSVPSASDNLISERMIMLGAKGDNISEITMDYNTRWVSPKEVLQFVGKGKNNKSKNQNVESTLIQELYYDDNKYRNKEINKNIYINDSLYFIDHFSELDNQLGTKSYYLKIKYMVYEMDKGGKASGKETSVAPYFGSSTNAAQVDIYDFKKSNQDQLFEEVIIEFPPILTCLDYHHEFNRKLGGSKNQFDNNIVKAHGGFFNFNIMTAIYHESIPVDTILCRDELEAGMDLYDIFDRHLYRYEGYSKRLDNNVFEKPKINHFYYIKNNGYINPLPSGVKQQSIQTRWINNSTNDTINSSNSLLYDGKTNINTTGTYRYKATIRQHRFGRDNLTYTSPEKTVDIKGVFSPIETDIISRVSYMCPGETLVLGNDLPEKGALNTNSIYNTNPNFNFSNIPSRTRIDSITYRWEKVENNVIKCIGQDRTQEITEIGNYQLTITHHHSDSLKNNAYYVCERTYPFKVKVGNQPTMPGGHAVICGGIPASLNAAVTVNPNQYNYEWSNGQTVQNISVTKPGTYMVKATHATSGCFVEAAFIVEVCGEGDYDKLEVEAEAPASIFNTVDPNNSSLRQFRINKEIIINSSPTNDPAIAKYAIIELKIPGDYEKNFNSSSSTTFKEFKLEIVYDFLLNGNLILANESVSVSNTLNSNLSPVFISVNKHQILDPYLNSSSDVDVEINIKEVNVFEIVSGSPNPVTLDLIPQDIELSLSLSIVQIDAFNNQTTNPITAQYNPNNKSIELQWNPSSDAVEYEIQIAFHDVYSPTPNSSSEIEEIFKKKGYSIELGAVNTYKFDLTFPEGKLYFRYRKIGRFTDNITDGNYSYRRYAAWSDTTTLKIDTAIAYHRDYNWQKVVSFAEEGKSKEVISFFDNTLRGLGSITRLSSDTNIVFRSHQLYDHEGRATLQIMPFPDIKLDQQDIVTSQPLAFEPHQYKVDISGSLFALDKSNFDFRNVAQQRLKSDYGSAKYYSDSSDFLKANYSLGEPIVATSPYLNYIPDAEGYVTTQSVFTNDATGRIARQSGVGKEHILRAPNSNSNDIHETRYFYSQPTSSELQRLFGKNVGKAEHYKTQAVLDPNGQLSISYLDMAGNTIATMLSGKSPDNLVVLERDSVEFTYNLNEKNKWTDQKKAYITSHDILNKNMNTEYTFNYDIHSIVNKIQYNFPGTQEVKGYEFYVSGDTEQWTTTGNNNALSSEDGFLKVAQGTSPISNTLMLERGKKYKIYIKSPQLNNITPQVMLNGQDIAGNMAKFSGNKFYFEIPESEVELFAQINFILDLDPPQDYLIDYIRIYEHTIIPEKILDLDFKNPNDFTENAGNITVNLSHSVNIELEGIDDDRFSYLRAKQTTGWTNHSNDTPDEFELTFDIQIPIEGDYEIFINMPRTHHPSEVKATILNGQEILLPEEILEVVHILPFTTTIDDTNIQLKLSGKANVPNNYLYREVLQLNAIKVYRLDSEEIFTVEECNECSYMFKTYITDPDGHKLSLGKDNQNQDIFEIIDTFSLKKENESDPDLYDCSAIGTAPLLGENPFNLEMGFDTFSMDGGTYQPDVQPNSSNISFAVILGEIGTYNVYKELVVSEAPVMAYLEQVKTLFRDGFVYNELRNGILSGDFKSNCIFSCEDLAMSEAWIQINDELMSENGFGITYNQYRDFILKGTNCPLSDTTICNNWDSIFEAKKSNLICNIASANNQALDSIVREIVETQCFALEADMITQISSKEEFWDQNENEYYRFLGKAILENKKDETKEIFDYVIDKNPNIKDKYVDFGQYVADDIWKQLDEDTRHDWEEMLLPFHREYGHYEVCELDVNGNTYLFNQRSTTTKWDTSWYASKIDDFVNNDPIPQPIKNIIKDKVKNFLHIEGLGAMNIKVLNGSTTYSDHVSLYDAIDERGILSCNFYSAIPQDLALIESTLLNLINASTVSIIERKRWQQCPNGNLTNDQMRTEKWNLFLNLYEGIRMEAKKEYTIQTYGNIYFEDEYAIVKTIANDEESVNDALYNQNSYDKFCNANAEVAAEGKVYNMTRLCNTLNKPLTPEDEEKLYTYIYDFYKANCSPGKLLNGMIDPSGLLDINTVQSLNLSNSCLIDLINGRNNYSPDYEDPETVDDTLEMFINIFPSDTFIKVVYYEDPLLQYQVCRPSHCMMELIDHYWGNNSVSELFTSPTCSFDDIIFNYNNLTLIKNYEEEEFCKDNCYTSFFWVDEEGNRVNLKPEFSTIYQSPEDISSTPNRTLNVSLLEDSEFLRLEFNADLWTPDTEFDPALHKIAILSSDRTLYISNATLEQSFQQEFIFNKYPTENQLQFAIINTQTELEISDYASIGQIENGLFKIKKLTEGSAVANVRFAASSKLPVPAPSRFGKNPTFAHFTAQRVDKNSLAYDPNLQECVYISTESPFQDINILPYVTQIFDNNNNPILPSGKKYLIGAIQNIAGYQNLSMLNADLRTVFNTNSYHIIRPIEISTDDEDPYALLDELHQIVDENATTHPITGISMLNAVYELNNPYSEVYNPLAAHHIFECLKSKELSISNDLLSQTQIQECAISAINENLLGSAEWQNVFQESGTAWNKYRIELHHVPEQLQIAKIEIKYTHSNIPDTYLTVADSTCVPIGNSFNNAQCTDACTYSTPFTTNNTFVGDESLLYISEIKVDGSNILPANSEFYLNNTQDENLASLRDLEEYLSLHFDSYVQARYDYNDVAIAGVSDNDVCAFETFIFNTDENLINYLKNPFEIIVEIENESPITLNLLSIINSNGDINEDNIDTNQSNIRLIPSLSDAHLEIYVEEVDENYGLFIYHFALYGIPQQHTFRFNDVNQTPIPRVNAACTPPYADSCSDQRAFVSTYLPEYDDENIPCTTIEGLYNQIRALNEELRANFVSRNYKFNLSNLPETAGSIVQIVLRSKPLPTHNNQIYTDTLNAFKSPGACIPNALCNYAASDKLYLYSIDLNPNKGNCGEISDQLCTTYKPIKAIIIPGQELMDSIRRPTPEQERDACLQSWLTQQEYYAQQRYEEEFNNLSHDMLDAALDRCKNVVEDFYYTAPIYEHHYTLYYYDLVGNLTQTVPPHGVVPLISSSDFNPSGRLKNPNLLPPHFLRTQYQYNSRNQVVHQYTPDAGETRFWYNRIGQLILSQNAKQKPLNQYSFTNYDKLGRIQWVGQMELPSNLSYSQVQDTINMADHKFPILKTHHQSQLTQLTHTIYDQAIDLSSHEFLQENLRNRVSASFRFDDYAAYQNYLSDPNNKENHIFTLYSYDEIGNVKRMANHTPRIVEGNNLWVDSKFKTIDYQYDLVSGNVNKVIYQRGKDDMFIHKYRYDADNRLEQVETSKDNVIWEKDAHYYYYPHGPLARIELGEHQVQGIDYYYTLQGWLKGINGKESNDPGKDGMANSPHATFPRDIFAMQLAYYQDDYKAIGNANANHLNNHWTHNLWNNHTDDVTQKNGLYNGNIAMQYTYLQPMQAGEQELVSHYRYDQLNRLKGAVGGFYDNNQLSATKSYKTEYSYDAMGNITHLKRQQGNTTYDSLRYYYEYNNVGIQTYNTGNQLLHNKLNRVQDLITSHNVANANDLPSGQNTDNYHYDSIGNLIQDVAEEIDSIKWDVYGKIISIKRLVGADEDKPNLEFKYDATGNRILKIVLPRNGNPIRVTSYHRDAQGNVLSTEESNAVPTSTTSPIPTTREYTLYGSSRLGVFKTYALGTTPQVGDYYMTKTDKYYELTNHLGNVMAVLSDAKHYDHNAQHFTTHTAQAQDYMPFGMLMPGRKYENVGMKYRYAFNGKEGYDEIYGSGGFIGYVERGYDPRRIQWLSVDGATQLYTSLSPYSFTANSPIIYREEDGNVFGFDNFIGGLFAAGTDFSVQLAFNLIQGKDLLTAVRGVNRSDLGVSFGIGFITSGANTITLLNKLPTILKSKTVIDGTIASVESMTKQYLNDRKITLSRTGTDVIGNYSGGILSKKLPSPFKEKQLKTIERQIDRQKRVVSGDPSSAGRQQKLADLKSELFWKEVSNSIPKSLSENVGQKVLEPLSTPNNPTENNTFTPINFSEFFPAISTGIKLNPTKP